MKRYLIPTVVVLMVLAVAWPAFAQDKARPPAERGGTRSPEAEQRERRGMFGSLSPEERARLRERFQNMSEEERQQFREQMRQRFAGGPPELDRRGALRGLEQQIEKLRADHEQFIAELREIRELAVKEKATETTKRLERLITKERKDFAEELRGLEQRRQRFERMLAARPPRQAEAEPAGKRAPDFTLKTFDGKTVSLSDYRGKIVVLEWFNFECPYLMYHYGQPSTMIKLANKYKDKNVVWLAMNSTSHTTPEANIDFAKKYKPPYPILDDRPGKVGDAYGAKTTPHMFIISPRGNIVYEGAIDNSPNGRTPAGQEPVNYVDKALAELTSGRPVSIKETKPYGCTVKYPR